MRPVLEAMLLLYALPALAQAPQRTSASYDDWTVRCDTQPGGTAKACEMEHTAQIPGEADAGIQVAIGRTNKAASMRIAFQIPVDVYLPAGLKFVSDERQPALSVAFTRCVPVGCFGDAPLPDALVRRLRARTAPGRIEFHDASRRDVRIPVSFRGFARAYEALLKE